MICFPLDNTEYTAAALGSWCATRTRGVFSADTHLVTTTNGDLTVTVSPGLAWLKPSEFWGVDVLVEEAQVLTSDTADGALTRYDAVCLRLDKNQNIPELILKKGPYGTNPSYPPLVRNLNYDEIFLAVIKRRPGATTILATDITDLRLDETYCGIMRDGVTGIPTQQLYDMWMAWFTQFQGETEAYFENYQQLATDLFAQYQAELAAYGNDAQAAYDAYVQRMSDYETTAQADFEAWVASLKDILDEETAGHLQNEIEELQTRFPISELGTVSTQAATPRLYPVCQLFATTWGFGMGGAGVGPAGGGDVVAIVPGLTFDEYDVTVTAPSGYAAYTTINQLSDTMYAFFSSNATDTQNLVLKITKEA